MKLTIEVQGMTCGGCKAAVEKVLGAQRGVTSVSVDLASGAATVQATETVAPEALVEAISRAGYDARIAG